MLRYPFYKVVSLMKNENIIYGGQSRDDSLKISPTIIDLPMRYQSYKKINGNIIRLFMK